VVAPDWDPAPNCGSGLHGWLEGEGDGSLGYYNEHPDAIWLVLAVEKKKCVDLGGKVKFPEARVLYSGTREEATALVLKHCPGKCVIGATATAGDRGTATAGYSGTATAGDRGVISIRYWDAKADRYRVMIGYIGENGLKPGVAYRLDDHAQFVEAK
jgi:hypothetical protein